MVKGLARGVSARLRELPEELSEAGWVRDLRTAWNMPAVSIDLMYRATADNAPFFGRELKRIYREFRRPHPRFPLVRRMQYGVALCELPGSWDAYFMGIEGSARRNYRKAVKRGYRFERIQFNDHLQDITDVMRSKEVRQGRMPEQFLQATAHPIDDPPTRTDVHDYPYFGVLKDDRLVAYAGCFVAGEVVLLTTIYGHGDHERDGVVPMLVIGIAGYVPEHYPHVRYYVYDTWFGASRSLRRFKKKHLFLPHKVRWILG
ncbi:MAG: hypothetical protein ACQEXJ_19775 [Myxococcota bacterium]